jgi:molybdate/tungstate transport system substrate-binding protein
MKKILTILTLIITLFSCKDKDDAHKIVIFHAGSLSIPMKEAADEYKKLHPEIIFELEAAGSIDCARKITELGRMCDILASADYTVIDKMLIPEYATENIPFATNEMAIVYTHNSRYANEINQSNWYEILQRPDVYYGRSDPNSDPCGYRTILTLKLSEKYYGSHFPIEEILKKDTRFIRPKEVDLLSLLESKALDYIFLYKSVAEQHHLPYLTLPPEINLGSETLKDLYASVEVKVRGSKPGDTLIITGTPMTYSLTIPTKAEHWKNAEKFVKFLIEEK